MLLAALLAALPAGACDNPAAPDRLEPAELAGTYDIAVLTFDPQGSALGTEDILARLDARRLPELTLTDTLVELAFVDPSTGEDELAEGGFTTGEETVRVMFADTAGPYRLLLLPQTLTYAYDEHARTLEFSGGTDVERARLTTLVPEFGDEALPDPVPGTLTVLFTRRAAPGSP